MWKRSHSKVFKSVDKEAIWQCWSDVNRWHEWVPNIEYCRLDKPFVAGNRFTLKPKGASAVSVELLEVEKGQKFTGCTRFFGATLYDTHEMRNDTNGIRVTVTLKVTGPLGFLWRKLVAEKIEATLPKLMQNLMGVSSSQEQKKAKAPLGSSVSKKVKPKTAASLTTKGKSMPSSSTSKKVTPIVSIAPTAKRLITPSPSAAKKVKPKAAASQPTKAKAAGTKAKTSASAIKKIKSKAAPSQSKKIKAKASATPVKKATKPKASVSKPNKAAPKKSASTAKKS